MRDFKSFANRYIQRAQASNLDWLANSRNIIGRNPSMVIPLLANQDLTPMLLQRPRKLSFRD